MAAASVLSTPKTPGRCYRTQGYWKGLAAIKKLAHVAKVSENVPNRGWSSKPFGKFVFQLQNIFLAPNSVCPRQMKFTKQTFFLPHDTHGRGQGRKTFRYALIVVDENSRFKEAEPLTSKDSCEVASAFQNLYKRGPLKWPQLLQVDPGWEFISKERKRNNTKETFEVRAQRFTGTRQSLKDSTTLLLSACLFSNMLLKRGCPHANNLTNRLFCFQLWSLLLTAKSLASQAKNPLKPSKKRPFVPSLQPLIQGPLACSKIGSPPMQLCRISTNPASLKVGAKGAADPMWSLKVYHIEKTGTKPNEPILYFLHDGPKLRSRGTACRACRYRAAAASTLVTWLQNKIISEEGGLCLTFFFWFIRDVNAMIAIAR